MKAELFTDGGARLNPGLAGIGVVLRDTHGGVIGQIARPIGTATNNVAEYTALIEGLKLALESGVTEIDIQVDSPVVAGHLLNTYKVKSGKLRILVDEVRALLDRFETHTFRRGDRSENADADRLANKGMDSSTSSMFTIHLDVPGGNASTTCSRCLDHRELPLTAKASDGSLLWDWMIEHANTGHEAESRSLAKE